MKKFALGTLLAGASLAAMASTGVAWAQTTPTAEPEADNEIIVTAQKREERLQDVPLTVSVVSGERLERQAISNLSDLQNATPELNYVGQPSAGYSIRGSGTQTFARSSENNVLLVIDGIVYGQLTPSEGSLFDIAQVEVLSGPQGMLFGKNASAGVINITTTRPVLGEHSGRLRLSAGEDGYFVANGVANLPIGETAALRVSASRDERGGRILNRFNGQTIDDFDNTSFRARLLWELTPDLSVNVIADTEKQNGGNNAWQARGALNTGPTTIGGRLATCGVTPGPENTEVCLDGPTSREIESKGASAQVDWTIADHTITSITGYRHYTRAVDTDSDTRPINALNQNFASDDITQWTQELRLSSPAEQRFSYVVGAFWYDYQYDSLNNQSGTLGLLPFVATRSFTDDVIQQSYALFGQGSFEITDTINLIFGARQTWDCPPSAPVRHS
jgi:iron complex outermembrane receptor protein